MELWLKFARRLVAKLRHTQCSTGFVVGRLAQKADYKQNLQGYTSKYIR